jgi:hypothetical protein
MDEVAAGTTTTMAWFSNTVTGTDSTDGLNTVTVSTQTVDGVSTGTVQIVLTGEATATV